MKLVFPILLPRFVDLKVLAINLLFFSVSQEKLVVLVLFINISE
jgi:hypothetical protein